MAFCLSGARQQVLLQVYTREWVHSRYVGSTSMLARVILSFRRPATLEYSLFCGDCRHRHLWLNRAQRETTCPLRDPKACGAHVTCAVLCQLHPAVQ